MIRMTLLARAALVAAVAVLVTAAAPARADDAAAVLAIPGQDAPDLPVEEVGPTLGVNAYGKLPILGSAKSGWTLPLWYRDEQQQWHFRTVDLVSGTTRDI